MATSIGSLFASLTLQSDQFVEGTKKASQAAESMSGRVTVSLKEIVKGVAELQVIEKIGEWFTEAVKGSVEFALTLKDTAEHAGVTVEQLQVLNQAAIMNGLSSEKMVTGMQKLNAELGKAQGGNKQAIQLFHDLKFTDEQIHSFHSGYDALGQVMDGMKALRTPAEQAAAAQQAMGKAGKDLTSTLSQGSGAMKEWQDAAEKAGIVTDAEAQRAHEADVAMKELAVTLKTQLAKAFLDNLPAIESLINGLTRLISKAAAAITWMQRVHTENAAFWSSLGKDLNMPVMDLLQGKGTNPFHARLQAGRDFDAGLNNADLAARFAADREARNAGDGGGNDLHLGGKGPRPKKPKAPKEDHAADLITKLQGEVGVAKDKLRVDPEDIASVVKYDEEQETFKNLQEAGKKATDAQKDAIRDLSKQLADTKALQAWNDEMRNFTKSTEESAKTMGMTGLQKNAYDLQKLIDKHKELVAAIDATKAAGGDPSAIIVTAQRVNTLITEGQKAHNDLVNATYADLLKNLQEEEKQLHMNSQELAVYNDLKGKTAGLTDAQIASLQAEAKQLEMQKTLHEEATKIAQEMGQISTKFLDDLIHGTKSFGSAFKDVITNLGDLMLQELVYKPLQDMMSKLVPLLEKLLTNVLGGVLGGGSAAYNFGASGGYDAVNANLVGGLAMGGDANAGQSYWVGEKGPEMFVPKSNGTIVPNNRLPNDGGLVINVDARNATNPAEVQAQVMQGIMAAMPMIRQDATAATMRKLTRPSI